MRSVIRRITPACIIVFICIFVFFGYRYALNNIKAALLKNVKQNFNTEISINDIKLSFPLCLELRDIEIEDAVAVPLLRIYIAPATFLLRNNIFISEISIIDPIIRIEKQKRPIRNISGFFRFDSNKRMSKQQTTRFYLSNINVKNATFIYKDLKGNDFRFVNIKANLRSKASVFSRHIDSYFAVEGKLKNKGTDFLSPLKIKGQIVKGGTVKAKLSIKQVFIDTLNPVYAKYLKSIVKKDKLNFQSNIRFLNDTIAAKCFIDGEGTSVVASFILLFDFKDKILKIRNFKGNILKLILTRFI